MVDNYIKQPGTALMKRNRNLVTSPGLKSVKSLALAEDSLASPLGSDSGLHN